MTTTTPLDLAAWGDEPALVEPHAHWQRRLPAALWLAEQGFGIVKVPAPNADLTDCTCSPGSLTRASSGPCSAPGKHPSGAGWQRLATREETTIRGHLRSARDQFGAFPQPGSRLAIVDCDDPTSPAGRSPWPDTFGEFGSKHASGAMKWHRYYRLPDDVDEADVPCTFTGGEIRVAGSGHCVGPWSQTIAGPEREPFGPRLIAELPAALIAELRPTGPLIHVGGQLPAVGNRHGWLRDRARHYAGTVRDADALKAALMVENAKLPEPKSEAEVDRAIGDVLSRFPADPEGPTGEEPAEPAPVRAGEWPEPLGDAAYHGVLGEIALAVAPYTEADPVGVLGTLISMFGTAAGGGRSLYQGSRQGANTSILLVGATGFGGRKGTALDVGRSVFRLAYPELDRLWLVGVASGEAITGHLGRKLDEARDKGGPAEDRVFLVEPEFGRLLTIMSRDGSTLSAVLRNAWDGVPLGHARARDESLVTAHHVSVLGHVTPTELRQKLTDTDAANGFANRILFLAVRRQRLIPFPVDAAELVRTFVDPLRWAIDEAQRPGALEFDGSAGARGGAVYAELALTPRLGLSGAVTGRHEAQVARLALVYALADRSPVVGAVHLEAAITLAEYARRSAVWALGDSTGNRHADVLRQILVDGPIPWNDAKRSLGLRTAADLAAAVEILVDAGLADVVSVAQPGGGRPRRLIQPKGAKGAKDARGARSKKTGLAT